LPLLATAAEVTVYYLLPLERHVTPTSVLWLMLGLAGFGVILVVQILRIAHSPYPRLRAVAAMLTSVPVFLLLFAIAYYLAEQSTSTSFNQHLTRTDALYFAVTVFSTVGFGDIVPTSETTRVLVMCQMVGDLVLIGLLGRVIVAAVGVGLQRRGPVRDAVSASSSQADDAGGTPSGRT
jgi:hypothetical protein